MFIIIFFFISVFSFSFLFVIHWFSDFEILEIYEQDNSEEYQQNLKWNT